MASLRGLAASALGNVSVSTPRAQAANALEQGRRLVAPLQRQRQRRRRLVVLHGRVNGAALLGNARQQHLRVQLQGGMRAGLGKTLRRRAEGQRIVKIAVFQRNPGQTQIAARLARQIARTARALAAYILSLL
jgi:hypothetical protein